MSYSVRPGLFLTRMRLSDARVQSTSMPSTVARGAKRGKLIGGKPKPKEVTQGNRSVHSISSNSRGRHHREVVIKLHHGKDNYSKVKVSNIFPKYSNIFPYGNKVIHIFNRSSTHTTRIFFFSENWRRGGEDM